MNRLEKKEATLKTKAGIVSYISEIEERWVILLHYRSVQYLWKAAFDSEEVAISVRDNIMKNMGIAERMESREMFFSNNCKQVRLNSFIDFGEWKELNSKNELFKDKNIMTCSVRMIKNSERN